MDKPSVKKSKKEITLSLSSPPPSDFLNLKQMFDQLVQRLQSDGVVGSVDERVRIDFIQDFTQAFASGTWSWRPIIEEVADDKVNRLGEVIKGPIYTSEEFPWPEASGFPMAPLIQLDLRKSSEIGGIELGDGLLQVWMPHEAITTPLFIRMVPRAYTDLSKLTPTVTLPDELEPLQKRGETWSDELERFVPCQSFQITGYEVGRYTCQMAHPIQDNYPAKKLSASVETQQLIRDFDKKLKSFLKNGPKSFGSNYCHLFGTFVRLQYFANEVPQPLFCFESDDLEFMWGDSGNAQLFYKIDGDGRVEFSFDWCNG